MVYLFVSFDLFWQQKQPPEVFCKKGVLKNVANFTGKHLHWSLYIIKLQVILKNICEWLLLWRTQLIPRIYNYLFLRAKILFCYYLCWLPACNFVKNGLNHGFFCFQKLAANEPVTRTWSWFINGLSIGNKDGAASDLSVYFKFPPRRHCFSSWISLNESLVKWSEHTWTTLGKTGLSIALIQASLIFFLPGAVFCDRKHLCWILTDLTYLLHSK